MLAYWGKRRKLVRIEKIENGVVISYYGTGEDEGKLFLPLIENGKNVEQFEIVKEK